MHFSHYSIAKSAKMAFTFYFSDISIMGSLFQPSALCRMENEGFIKKCTAAHTQ